MLIEPGNDPIIVVVRWDIVAGVLAFGDDHPGSCFSLMIEFDDNRVPLLRIDIGIGREVVSCIFSYQLKFLSCHHISPIPSSHYRHIYFSLRAMQTICRRVNYIYIGRYVWSMREVTMTLKIDQIGRVGIPKVIRDEYGIRAGDLVELKLVVDDEKH